MTTRPATGPPGHDRHPRTSMVRTTAVGVAGAALAAVASAQTWASATVTSPAARTVAAKGTEVAPIALPLSLVALVAWGSVLVLRRTGRRAVAVLGLLSSVGVVVAVAMGFGSRGDTARGLLGGSGAATVSTTGWPVAAVVGALIAACAFVVAVLKAAGWPEMSRRYDAPGSSKAAEANGAAGSDATETGDRELWRALDEGRDPTL